MGIYVNLTNADIQKNVLSESEQAVELSVTEKAAFDEMYDAQEYHTCYEIVLNAKALGGEIPAGIIIPVNKPIKTVDGEYDFLKHILV